ncbi:Uncharacterised protein [uncultured archaeon]|nr:Uncharacterised protein [uncultured archaeon]
MTTKKKVTAETRNREVLYKAQQKCDWLKRQSARLHDRYSPYDYRIDFANSQYRTVETMCRDRPCQIPPDPLSQILAKDLSSNNHENYNNALFFLGRMAKRYMAQERYMELSQYYCGRRSPESSNPVEERPSIIFPDAQQYKADMGKLAKGLVQRLGAVKVE